MSMPNRFEEVSALCAAHPEAFPPGAPNDAARLAFLTATVIPALNLEDLGNWGLATKTEQGDRVPVDVMMWRDTREIVDCLTGSGACWLTFETPPPDTWLWTAVGDPPPSGVGYDDAEVVGFAADVVASYAEAHATVNVESSVWGGRMVWDAPLIGWAASRAKHLDELRSALELA